MRSAGLVLAASSAMVASLAGCGGDSGGGGGGSGVEEPEVDRLGCHEFCQQAGGYGAGGEAAAQIVRIDVDAPVMALADGTVPVKLTCDLGKPCTGALLLDALTVDRSDPLHPEISSQEMGRSDLVVGARATRTLGIPLSAFGRQWLQQNGRVKAFFTADVRPTFDLLPPSEQAEVEPVSIKEIVLSKAP
jgi:hypothetical protein